MHNQRRALVVVLALAVGAMTMPLVWGYFSSPGVGDASAAVGSLSAPGKPAGTSSSGTVNAGWSASDAGGGAVSYYVERRPQPGSTWSFACGTTPTTRSTLTSCADTPGAPGTYVYRVNAVYNSWTTVSVESDPIVVTGSTPTLGAPSPTTGNVGASATITGSNFAPNASLTVTVGGVVAVITAGGTSNGSGGVNTTFTVPAEPAGTYAVAVSDGASSATSGTNFTITRSIALSPTTGGVGSSVTVSGSAFPASSGITALWDGVALALAPASPVTDASGSFSSVSFTVPGSGPGAHTIQFSAGGQSASASFTVTYAACTVTSPSNYISIATGDWSSSATWARCVGTTWTSDGTTPTSASGAVTIQSGNVVSAAAAVTVDQVTVNTGATLGVNSGQTLTLNNGTGTDLVVNGALSVTGTVSLPGSTSLQIAGGGTGTVNNGGIITGGGGNAATAPPLTVDGALVTASGGLISGSNSGPLTITVNGSLDVQGTVNELLTLTVNAGGSVNVTGSVTLQHGSGTGNLTVTAGGTVAIAGSGNVTSNRGNAGNVMSISGSVTLTGTATITPSGTGTMTVNSGGAVDLGPTAKVTGNVFTLASGGNLLIASPAGITSSGATGNVQSTTRNFTTGANYRYDGSAAQVTGSGLPATVNNLTFANTSGVTLSASVTASGTLDLQSTAVSTGANTLTVSSDNAVARASGYVAGNLKLHVATGSNVARVFPVGTAGGYTPVTVSFPSVTVAGSLTVLAVAGDNPNIGTSTLNASKSLNRYWTFTNSGIAFTNYSSTFGFPGTFGSGDAQLDTGTNTAALRVANFNAPTWTYPTLGTRTSTSTQATGIATFGDFQLAE